MRINFQHNLVIFKLSKQSKRAPENEDQMTIDYCVFHHRTEDSLCACTRKDTFCLTRWL